MMGTLLPSEYSLEQNFPNPFNPSTTIQFSIPERSFVTLEIFNALGEKITTLVSEELNAGNHKYEWNPETQPGGVYFYKLSTNSFQQTKKLVLIEVIIFMEAQSPLSLKSERGFFILNKASFLFE